MENKHKKQMVYQKTLFNIHLIYQQPCILKCSKCKKNNNIVVEKDVISQNCLFCGTPNYITLVNPHLHPILKK
jgi:hypothetical protein